MRERFDLGKPSWVLQIFGVDPRKNLQIFRKSFIHALLNPNEVVLRERGKHGLTDEEAQGSLVAIQQPLAVLRSTNIGAKEGENSLILLTELKQRGKNIVAPPWLTTDVDGKIVVDNQIPPADAKKDLAGWIKGGLLLGYEKEKGLEVLLESMGSNSQQLGTSSEIQALLSRAVVYRNETSVGDLYQRARGRFSPISNTIVLTPNADLSTFSHELAHWYLLNLLELSNLARTSARLHEDAQAVLNEFALDSVEAWDALGLEGQRKYHERFVYWTEIYFATGKAPVSGLRKFFDRLGAWIRDVYFKETMIDARGTACKHCYGGFAFRQPSRNNSGIKGKDLGEKTDSRLYGHAVGTGNRLMVA